MQSLPGRAALSMATRYWDGGRDRFIHSVRLAAEDDESAKVFIGIFDGLHRHEQRSISFDDICFAGGIKTSELMSAVVKAAMDHGEDVADMAAVSVLPKIVQQMGKSAMRITGEHAEIAQKDRMALLQHHHFVPIPKNATMNVNVNTHSSSNSQAAAAASSEPSMPGFMDDVGSLQTTKESVQKELSGVVDADVIETSRRIDW